MTDPRLPVLNEMQSVGPQARTALNTDFSLSDLLDVRRFREVCVTFTELYKVGLKIFDANGEKLVDIRVGNGDWCSYIFQNKIGRKLCTELVTKIRTHDYQELENNQKVIKQECFSGLQYVIMPINYGGDTYGRVVFGPYLPRELRQPYSELFGWPDFDGDELWDFRKTLRRLSEDAVERIIRNFLSVVDTVILSSMKSVLTQRVHVESITDAYNELAETNIKLKSSLAELKELDKMKSNFLAVISHELKTPLTSVIGYSEMLLEGMAGDMSDEQRDFVTTIKEKGESLLSLIGNLLDLSKIEAGKLNMHFGPTQLASVANHALTSVLPQAKKKSIEVSLDVADELPTLHADAEKLTQCFVNLMGNAVKFTEEKGQIWVRAKVWRGSPPTQDLEAARFGHPEEDFVRLEVEDNGIGIPEDKVEKVFSRFYQTEGAMTRKHGGTGLGLAIVRDFVEAHKGVIWAESRLGKGTTFVVLLPLEKQPEPA